MPIRRPHLRARRKHGLRHGQALAHDLFSLPQSPEEATRWWIAASGLRSPAESCAGPRHPGRPQSLPASALSQSPVGLPDAFHWAAPAPTASMFRREVQARGGFSVGSRPGSQRRWVAWMDPTSPASHRSVRAEPPAPPLPVPGQFRPRYRWGSRSAPRISHGRLSGQVGETAGRGIWQEVRQDRRRHEGAVGETE